MKAISLLLLFSAAATAACEPQTAGGRTPGARSSDVAGADSAVLKGTPPGDLSEWVADMRRGLDSIAEQMSGARSSVHVGVLTLYATRQEFLEAYYGANGRMRPSAALAEAVVTAESRFHDLMRLTSSTPPSEEQAIRAAIEAVDRQLAVVLELRNQTERRLRGENL